MWHDGTSMYHYNQFLVKVSHHVKGECVGMDSPVAMGEWRRVQVEDTTGST